MITDVDGVMVGHWTDPVARTGCTVAILPTGTVASGEVRGGAPATREFALLDPHRLVVNVDAVMLSGGSAFGLAAADGAVQWLEQRGRGFATSAGPVPIVVGLSLFDLLVGDGSVRPGAAEGLAACEAATAGPIEVGRVGAGAGATIGKWRGRERARPAGVTTASVTHGGVVVSALLAVNAFGDIDRGDGAAEVDASFDDAIKAGFMNTVIGLVATNAALDKIGCHVVAQGGHDGLARAIFPPHTRYDGDALVAAATGVVPASIDLVRALAVLAVERAIRAVRSPVA
jgi:L-aminopeptidase/D-esterase-like protein